MIDKIKTISKYVVNFLNMINALIIALSPIWNWHLDNITKTIVAITGIISLYLVGGKLFDTKDEIIEEKQTTFNTKPLDLLVEEGVVENVDNENNKTSE